MKEIKVIGIIKTKILGIYQKRCQLCARACGSALRPGISFVTIKMFEQ